MFLYAEDSKVDAAIAVVIRFFEQGKLPRGMRIGRAIYEDKERRNWHFQPAYPPALLSSKSCIHGALPHAIEAGDREGGGNRRQQWVNRVAVGRGRLSMSFRRTSKATCQPSQTRSGAKGRERASAARIGPAVSPQPLFPRALLQYLTPPAIALPLARETDVASRPSCQRDLPWSRFSLAGA